MANVLVRPGGHARGRSAFGGDSRAYFRINMKLLILDIYFMKVITDSVNISTQGNTDIIDVTQRVEDLLNKTGLKQGNLTVFVSGSTAGLRP